MVARTRYLIGIETCSGLVQNQYIWLVKQSLCHADTLPKPFGQLADGFVDNASEITQFDRGCDAFFLACGAHAAGVREKAEQAKGGHIRVQRPVFGEVSKSMGTGNSVTEHIVTRDFGSTLTWSKVAGKASSWWCFFRPRSGLEMQPAPLRRL